MSEQQNKQRFPVPSVILRGNTSSGEQVVFARAAKLDQEGVTGRSILAPELLALAARQARREEPVDVILVTADAHHSLLLPLPPGLTLAGVVSEWETDPRFTLPNGLTVVGGVTGARDNIEEGEWLIVDPIRQRITVAPDPGAIARLQHRARPRYRLLDSEQTARTLTGQEVLVWARVSTEAELEEALEAGADGVVLEGPGDFLPESGEDADDADVMARLLHVVDALGGGDIGLLAEFDAVDPVVLVRIAALSQLHLILQAESLPLSLPELRAELQQIVDEETDAGRLAAMPRFSALVSNVPTEETDSEEFLGFQETALLPFLDSEIESLTFSALLGLPPLFVFLSGASDPFGDAEEIDPLEMLPAAVAAGVRGLIVATHRVAAAKEAILWQE